ncbi:hypothetical protein F4775DRAFT_606228 [Biscogniauxia sp. FL1348]|nr:hypothetical protein F4775DRAFT_606228 [Biscogniauxia sp. FL1348]
MRITIGPTTSDVSFWHMLGFAGLLYVHPSTRPLVPLPSGLVFWRPELLWLAELLGGFAGLGLLVRHARALGGALGTLVGFVVGGARRAWRGPVREYGGGLAAALAVPRPGPGAEARAWARWMAYTVTVVMMWAMVVAWVYAMLMVVRDGVLLLGGEKVFGGAAERVTAAVVEDAEESGVLACYSRHLPAALWTVMEESFVGRAKWRYNADGTCVPLSY